MAIETVKVKHSDDAGNDHLIINRSDYDPDKHQLAEGERAETDQEREQREIRTKDQASRAYEANRGIPPDRTVNNDGRNPSGTYSEPTPSDIRYANKDETEFENNHGAFINKSAAQMRAAKGLPDAPGGLAPNAPHVGKGPRGKWYVKHGRENLHGPFETEDEAKAAMPADDEADPKTRERETRQSADQSPFGAASGPVRAV